MSNQQSGIEECLCFKKHSAMGSTESQMREFFWHLTTNWNLGLHRFWIDDSNGVVVYRSKWFEESELAQYCDAAYSVARMCNHNLFNEYFGERSRNDHTGRDVATCNV